MEFKKIDTYHVPIMAKEVIDGLNVRDGIYLDCTLGGGGHSELILRANDRAKLIAIDKDLDAIDYNQRLKEIYGDRITLVHDDYSNIVSVLDNLKINGIDGALLDLGISSHQIDTAERGFSYMQDALLDMRMNREQTLMAREIVNEWEEDEIADLIQRFGEDPFAKKIAKKIVEERIKKPIETTFDLNSAIEKCVPMKLRFKLGHPAKKTFQAIRIVVNSEIVTLERTLEQIVERLHSGGRLAVITFHSLEDRIVKNLFRLLQTDCICDKHTPICICNHKASVKRIGDKFTVASTEEVQRNARSSCAKLRVIEKL